MYFDIIRTYIPSRCLSIPPAGWLNGWMDACMRGADGKRIGVTFEVAWLVVSHRSCYICIYMRRQYIHRMTSIVLRCDYGASGCCLEPYERRVRLAGKSCDQKRSFGMVSALLKAIGVTSVPSIVLAATAQAQAIMLGARAAAKAAAAVDVWPSEGCLPVKKQRTEDLASQSQDLLPPVPAWRGFAWQRKGIPSRHSYIVVAALLVAFARGRSALHSLPLA